ncbi:MAG: phage tail tube protein [Candidatus Bathyarchaeota archaeon]|nr:phage tail tube protein [Candidatus Bathyarchaeota archaeon]
MPETYSAHESRLYFVDEAVYGETPTDPSMFSVTADSIEPAVNPSNIKLRGIGSIDLQTIKKGLRAPTLKLSYPLPSESPISFLQYAKKELEKSLSIQLLYYKGVFSAATDIISLLYTGCKFQKLQVECSTEDVVKASAELVAQNVSTGTAKLSGANYADYEGAVPFYDSYIKKGATTLERVTDWKFNVENSLKQVSVVRASNGHLLKYLPYRSRSLTGEVVFEFESKEEFDDIINDESFSLEFGLGATNKATFTDCKWENITTPARIEELISLKAGFVAKTFTIT